MDDLKNPTNAAETRADLSVLRILVEAQAADLRLWFGADVNHVRQGLRRLHAAIEAATPWWGPL